VPLLAPGIGPLGIPELLILLVIVVLIFGAGRLPEVGGAVGKSIREFRKATKDGDEESAAKDATMSAATPAATSANGSANVTSSETTFCGECGTKNPRTAKFCASCGHQLGTPVS
jgi:sec-independent protein translocase protein TatA